MATRRDAGAELEYAVHLINRVIDGVDGIRSAIHICRGNWSRRDDVLLTGDYAPLAPSLMKMAVDQFVLEFATPRAGELSAVAAQLSDREIGLGVVNPRGFDVESEAQIIRRVEEALQYFSKDRVFLNPDCGFGTFSNRNINDEETATAKLQAMVTAAQYLRKKYAS